ncbi:MAG: ArsA family ATPase [Bacteroidota bacterium]
MNDKPGFVTNKNLRLLLFGGKGGAGKTTIAAATSLYLSELYPKRKLLIVSTDPTHSLSDSFEYPLGELPARVHHRSNLFGMEMNAEKTFTDFKRRYGKAIEKIIKRGTYLDDDDVPQFLGLSFPGLDEMMAIVQMIELLEQNSYDLIIFDTSPTGHTMKLLTFPRLLEKWVAFLDIMMAKHRIRSQIYARDYQRDDADAFIEVMFDALGKVQSYLQDEKKCQFVPVTLLEPMVLAETKRLVDMLSMQKIHVEEIVVNRVMDPRLCNCSPVMTQWEETRNLLCRTDLHRISLTPVPYFPFEVKGEAKLKIFAESALERGPGVGIDESCFMKTGEQNSLRLNNNHPTHLRPPAPQTQFVLFGGKGGVGKTTVASSFALNLASIYPDKRILLFSTDPAHSLSDSLGQAVGDKVTAIEDRGKLFALEIDAEKHFEAFKEVYAEEISEVFDRVTHWASADIAYDREVMANLMELTPPGLDEIMSLIEIMNYVNRDEYDLYVLDNAPTGHALRFLELPELMRNWLTAFFKILLKYQDVVGISKAAELLVDMSWRLKKTKEILSDPLRCEFIPVSIPTQMALAETQRSILILQKLNIPVKRMIVNMMIDQSVDCEFCSVLRRQQEKVLSEHKQAFPEIDIITIPRVAFESREDLGHLLEFSSLDGETAQSNKRRFSGEFIRAPGEGSISG